MTSRNCRMNKLGIDDEELFKVENKRSDYYKSMYNVDFTKKKMNKNFGLGKVDAFVDGDTINPKLSMKGDKINAEYIRKNQKYLALSKTGITTYQYDFCGYKPKNINHTIKINP